MSLYVARSPYRSSSGRRSNLRAGLFKLGSFARLGGLFKKRDSRIDRSASVFSLKGFRRARRERRRVSLAGGLYARPTMAMAGGLGAPLGRGAGLIGGSVTLQAKTFAETLKKMKDVKMRYVFGPSTVMVGLGVFAVLASLAYLMHFNQVATKGYDLKRLQADQNQLMSQYEIKNMRLAEIKALNTIATSERAGAMRRPANVTFVHGNTALASR